jgi:glycolate oxidase iron-sulfur subunit
VARGRIYLARLLVEGKHDFTKDDGVLERVDDCLLCGACVASCPSSVKTDEIMLAARNDFVANLGLPLFQRLVFRGLLSRKERLERVSALMRAYERSGARDLLYGKVLRRALDKLVYFDSFLPKSLDRPARLRLPEAIRPASAAKLKVLYFIGCASNVFFSGSVVSAVSYLASRGAEISVPKVSCCGEPHRTRGDLKETRRLALKNSPLVFQGDYDAIVSDCSTCAKALSHYDDFVGADSREAERIRPYLSKVVDLNTLVTEKLGLETTSLKPTAFSMVTYHDPCHANRGLGIKEAPRLILKSIPGLELAEMEGADSCCGGAGSYCFTHPGMSGRIASSKAQAIAKTGASLVSTSCPACALQLGAGLKRADLPKPVLHPVELLAQAAGIGQGKK